jgi:hypothetical protein
LYGNNGLFAIAEITDKTEFVDQAGKGKNEWRHWERFLDEKEIRYRENQLKKCAML